MQCPIVFNPQQPIFRMRESSKCSNVILLPCLMSMSPLLGVPVCPLTLPPQLRSLSVLGVGACACGKPSNKNKLAALNPPSIKGIVSVTLATMKHVFPQQLKAMGLCPERLWGGLGQLSGRVQQGFEPVGHITGPVCWLTAHKTQQCPSTPSGMGKSLKVTGACTTHTCSWRMKSCTGLPEPVCTRQRYPC